MTGLSKGILVALVVAAVAGAAWWTHMRKTVADDAAAAGSGAPRSSARGQWGAKGDAGDPAAKGEAGAKAGKASGDRNRPVPAVIEPVRAIDVPVTVNALGTVTPRQQAVVRARVDGLLQSISFAEGATVKAGAMLARIDPRPFEAALSAASGQLAKDQAQLDIARTDLQRYRKLLTEDSIASQQVDAQVALVRQLEGTVAADKGNVASAQLNLSFTTITAPIAGRAGLRQVDPGNMIRAGDANGIVVISEVQPITVVFSVPQESLPQIVARMHAGRDNDNAKPEAIKVEAMDRDARTVLDVGSLLAVDNQTDPATGSIKLKALFANDAQRLFPGQFVNVRVTVDTLIGALTIPQSAVQRGAPGTFVYAVTAEQTAALRKVQLGPVAGDRVVVLDGLRNGERLVVDGADKLRDGAPVTTVAMPGVPERGTGNSERLRRGADGERAAKTDGAERAPKSEAADGAPKGEGAERRGRPATSP